ncbi:MAG: PAS domain S-box protein [Dehalococcoidia bacterium]|nr:PAS domain S-box protein [Dehalococcoidia bacterium]
MDDQKQLVRIREVSHRLLRITNVHSSLRPLLQAFLKEVLASFKFEAGGIRLIDDSGLMPFAVYEGFSQQFLDYEASSLTRSHRNMCVRVVDGATDIGSAGFTQSGVFYVGSASQFVGALGEADRIRLCGLCSQFGYESVLLAPIQLGHRNIGLLHLASRQPDLLSTHAVETIGRTAIQLGTAIQRVRAEEALRESEARYRDLFNDASDAIIVRDLKGNIIEANRAAAELTGYSIEELLRTNIFQLLTPIGFQITMARQKSLLEAQTAREWFELELIRKDGTRAVVESVTRLIARDGRPAAIEAMVRDITERKRMELDLAESEKNFRALAEHSSDGILVMNFRGRYIYANRAAAEITGYRVDELLKMHVKALTHPDEHYKILERAKQRREGRPIERQFETVFVRKDGKSLPVELALTRTVWYGQPSVIVIFRDIVERKKLRNYVTEVTKAQEEERKRISRELHDETIQSLAALALDIQAVTRVKPRLPKAVLERLEDLRRRTNAIIDGVRRFSYELRPDVLDQLGLIAALETLTNDLGKDTDIRAHVEVIGMERRLAPDLELALFRIAQEALRNVRKHSMATKVVITVAFEIDSVKLKVTDNGQGFEVADGLSDFVSRGKLGLVGMEERVRLFNGKLKIQSQPGKGTTILAEVAG